MTNNVKNLVIVILSILVLIQAALLLYVLRRPPTAPTIPREMTTRPPVPAKEVGPVAPALQEKKVPAPVLGKIVLILDDWGYNLRNADFISENDFKVTLSVLPFRAYSEKIAKLAHDHHKDVIVHMPMEPQHKENYGLEENTVLTAMDKDRVTELLEAAFRDVPYAKGLSNHMGSRATEDKKLMRIVMSYLQTNDLLFVDSMVTNKSVCRGVARSMKGHFVARDIFIDNESDEVYIRQQLIKLATLAKKNGMAVGIGHDRPVTIAVLKEMIPILQEQGYVFVNIFEATATDRR